MAHAIKIWVMGHSRSLTEFDRTYATSYQSVIVTIALSRLSCTIFELFDVEKYYNLGM